MGAQGKYWLLYTPVARCAVPHQPSWPRQVRVTPGRERVPKGSGMVPHDWPENISNKVNPSSCDLKTLKELVRVLPKASAP